MKTPEKTVLVSGCFDGLHSGHVAFLQAAAEFGRLHVALGSDSTIAALKGRPPVFTQDERLYLVRSLACIHDAFVSSGSGRLDFEPELRRLRCNSFVVNHDGHCEAKELLCRELGVEYRVLVRSPAPGLPERSSSELRQENRLPYRLDLAGGWLDQPFVSRLCSGPVLTVSLEPTHTFADRSGMATSTRNTAWRLWGGRLPAGDWEATARTLFACENPPGTVDVSGSQDAIGIVYPGFNRLDYAGEYWPRHIETNRDEAALQLLESHLHLLPLVPRGPEYHPLHMCDVTVAGARSLSLAADACWNAAMVRDLEQFGRQVTASFEAQLAMFPAMATETVMDAVAQIRDRAFGWKLSGAGGGGYLAIVAPQPLPDTLPVKIRRAGL